ncbi:enoyl-CoA hydratase/isomerase family protein [Ferrimonas marina]|uniref:Methylglutaconyl-CoA hydratase n=1 Tax=Ferrimonas marina TaxID=299255 RepID=A0A1M5VMU5_9GAMM|nr:enoyl-CoA hydratase/isomerase family protein [Ferrimonas marina]SHH76571.1 methylglutaconyl-CoA hydratase [Ferrimonas marina]
MTESHIKVQQQGRIARLVLNRPDKHNAFNAAMIQQITDALQQLSRQPELNLLVLQAEGKHFCAGADLAWMQSQAQMSAEENHTDALALAQMLNALDRFPAPVMALVQGAAYGGALGLIACADLVLAKDNARFCLSEVKLGLIPATISPYVARAIGHRQLRRYALGAETLDAQRAEQLGLVHQVVSDLDSAAEQWCQRLQQNGPMALRACKELLRHIEQRPLDQALMQDTAHRIARVRVSPEGQEGLTAFFNKRQPHWQGGQDDTE